MSLSSSMFCLPRKLQEQLPNKANAFDPIRSYIKMADLEADDAGFMEFTSLSSRLDSFRHGEQVQCFSCRKIIDNWSSGDTPVEKHRLASPTCRFIDCIYPKSSHQANGDYNEEAEALEYRLRTGAVMDETTYPIVPHMRSEEARLQTFTDWPSASPVKPSDLAQAGLYYLGESDHVQCFCCNGNLARWAAGDTAWGEHEKHFPNCFFVLGHDVGNIPLQGGSQEQDGGRGPHMATFEQRLESFQGTSHPISPERLAQAGFYSTGTGDRVLCFSCKGGLKGWQPEEDPWVEHAKHFPGCSFLLSEKGQEFINNIQLQSSAANVEVRHENGFSKDNGADCLNKPSDNSSEKDEDTLRKLKELQREKQYTYKLRLYHCCILQQDSMQTSYLCIY
uniref:RING-type E3 ubiquitin transferase n=1 Tax=Knipowitschia caucasica TaxID=637954 RepID=A0AAV2ML68_KNICA